MLSSFSLKQMNLKKANVVNPIKKEGSMKLHRRPIIKFAELFAISN